MEQSKTPHALYADPAFYPVEHETGLLEVHVSDWLKSALRENFALVGYVAGDESVHIPRLKQRLAKLIGPRGEEFLWKLATGEIGEGLVVFKNLPFEHVVFSPIPGMPALSAKDTSLSEHLLLAFSAFFGDAYGVASEGSRLVNDLIPSQQDIERFTGNGSRQPLGIHTENAALRFVVPGRDFSPKFLMLTAVSAQRYGGPTTPVAISSRAINRLDEKHIAILRSPCMRIGLPFRQRKLSGGKEEVGPVPVIIGPEGGEQVIAAFYGDMMRPICDEAREALEELRRQLEEVSIHLNLVPGVLVYIANGRVMHGRSNFEPYFDEYGRAQRWLQRVFGTGRLDAFFECRACSDRVFDIDLSGNIV